MAKSTHCSSAALNTPLRYPYHDSFSEPFDERIDDPSILESPLFSPRCACTHRSCSVLTGRRYRPSSAVPRCRRGSSCASSGHPVVAFLQEIVMYIVIASRPIRECTLCRCSRRSRSRGASNNRCLRNSRFHHLGLLSRYLRPLCRLEA
jgi:hypothetical protein